MATVFKTLRASDVILAPSGGVNSITTRSGFLELKSASSNDVRLAYDLPSNDRSVATKVYVDSVSQGLSVKEAVRARTSTALGGSNVVYALDSGVMTITAAADGKLADAKSSFDGVTLVANDRVLYASESGSDQKYHGLYYVVNVGGASAKWVLKRTTDADNVTITSEVKSGIFTFVTEGTTYAGSGWVLSTANPITLDTTSLVFTQFSGSGSITLANVGTGQGVYASTTGSTLNLNSLAAATGSNSSSALEVATASNTITYKFDSSKITSTGTLTSGSINWSGDIKTTGAITASGSNISGVNVTASGVLTGDTVSIGAGGTITYSSTTSGANKLILPNTTADAFSIIGATSNKKYITVNTSGDNVIFPQSKIDLSTAAGTVTLLGNSATSLAFSNSGTDLLVLDTTTSANKVFVPQGVIKFGTSTAAVEIDGNTASTFDIRNIANTKNYLSVDSSTDIVSFPQGKLDFLYSSGTNFNILTNNADSLVIKDKTTDDRYLSLNTSAFRVNVEQTLKLQSGFVRFSTVSSSGATLNSSNDIVGIQNNGSPAVVTLDNSSSSEGACFKIIKLDNSANIVTILLQSGDKLNGVTDDTIVLYSQSESVSLYASNGSWYIE